MRNIHIVPLIALLASACSASTVVGPTPLPPAPIVTPTPTPASPAPVLPTLVVGLHVTNYDVSDPHFVAVVFGTEASEGLVTYAYDYGDGVTTLNGQSSTTAHEYPLVGRWTVTVTGRTGDGRSTTATRVVTTPPCQTLPSEGCR